MSIDVFKDISVLYELSLSVGGSLDLKKNCENFLSVLMSRKNLDYCSVWIHNNQFPGLEEDDKFRAVYANPEIKLPIEFVDDNTPVFTQFNDDKFYSICSTDEGWEERIVENYINGGAFAYYRLGSFGFLKIYSSIQEGRFDNVQLYKLANIIQKFTVSIQACLYHQRSMYNAELKMEAERAALESSSKLDKTTARLSHIIKNIQDAILVEDEHHKVLYVNDKLIKYFNIGATSDSLLGGDSDYVCEQVKQSFTNQKEFVDQVMVILRGRKIKVGEEMHLADGRILIRDFIPINIDGEYRGHLWQFRDVTSSEKLLSDLKESKLAAEFANASKSNFLANMSHEIRTPLNAISGMSKLLNDSGLNVDQKSFNEAIHKSSENLLVIVNEILDFSKIEAGKLTLEKVGINVSEVFQDVITTMEFKASEKSLRLTSYIDENIPNVMMGDPVRLTQVLMNLLSNALKFTPDGFVHVDCRLFTTKDINCVLRLSVEDSGIGIEDDRLASVFEDFTQADTTITRKFGGTGLGLSIVKKLVELMGGDIDVSSTLGKGTVFTVSLPFEIATVADLKDKEIAQIDPIILKGRRVLLVDDHSINRFLVVSLFKSWNVEIDEAENGEEAVQMLQERAYDVVLMDKQMPVMDGLEATRHIRSELKMTIPIIALSANVMKDAVQECLDAGMDDFLPKPFEHNDMLMTIVKLLRIDISTIAPLASSSTQESPVEEVVVPIEEVVVQEKVVKKSPVLGKRYDLAALAGMVNNDERELKKLVNMFLTSTPDMLDEIEVLREDESYDRIGKLVHKMKPSVTLMRMNELIPLLPLIEDYQNTISDKLDGYITTYVSSMREIVTSIKDEHL